MLSQSSFDRLAWVEFAQPAWLLLFPVLGLWSWWIARNALGGWQGGRETAHLIVRLLLLALVAATLAEPSVRWAAKDVAVVVITDVSDSIPAEQRRRAESFLRASANLKQHDDRLGLLSAAEDAFVQTLPVRGHPSIESGYVGTTHATDLEQAVRLAGALMPSDAAGRVLLISDGNQTRGSLALAANAARSAGLPIDVAAVEYDRTQMVRVRDVVMPAWTRENDRVNVKVVIESGREVSGRLSLMMNGTLIDLGSEAGEMSGRLTLTPGVNTFTVPLRLTDAPVHQINAAFEPDADPVGGVSRIDVPDLLRGTGVTFTSSRGRVLVLAEDPATAGPLLGAIRSDELTIETRKASELPSLLSELIGYDAIVLVNQPAFNFTQLQQEHLVSYVRDGGGGLVVLGGPEGFGAGGWIGSPLADALPVILDPPQKRQMPMGALALIIDCSGSMGAPVGVTNLTQQQVANEAAILGVRALSRLDQVAVIAFSDGVNTVVPLTVCSDPESIARRVRSVGPGGGTNLFPAIEAASAELDKSPAGVKHVIILTDGQTTGDPAAGIAKVAALRGRGITVSTVSIGDASNDDLLRRLATTGGGRSYEVAGNRSLASLPQIFVKEAQTVRRTLIWEGPPFSPRVAMTGDGLRGIRGPMPGVTGYVVTGDRGGLSSVLLRGPEDDPVLAQWQHGLGRVTAFTSDAATRWNAAWITWSAFDAFWQQQLRWSMRPTGDPRARVSVSQRGDAATIALELFDDAGERLDFARVRGRAMHSGAADASPSDITFRQTGPGLYEAEFRADETGVHLAALQYEAPQGRGGVPQRGSVRAALVRSAGEEVRRPIPDTELLWNAARQTNGRIYKLDEAGIDLWARDQLSMPTSSRPIWSLGALFCLLLLMIDVAGRRIAIDPHRIRARLAALVTPAPAKRSESLQSLAEAKARTADTLRPARSEPEAHAVPGIDSPLTTFVVAPSQATTPGSGDVASPKAASDQTSPAPSGGSVLDRLREAKQRSRRE